MGKGGRCARLTTLPPSCAVVMKSRSLNFLEPSGPLQACSGTDFFYRIDITITPPCFGDLASYSGSLQAVLAEVMNYLMI